MLPNFKITNIQRTGWYYFHILGDHLELFIVPEHITDTLIMLSKMCENLIKQKFNIDIFIVNQFSQPFFCLGSAYITDDEIFYITCHLNNNSEYVFN